MAGLGLSVLDLVGIGLAGAMVAMLIGRARRNLVELATMEPAANRR